MGVGVGGDTVADVQSDTDPRRGWYKLLIPDIKEVFGGLFWSGGPEINPLPFVYGRLDPDQVSFDCTLSIPFLAIDRVVLAQIDTRPGAQQPVADGQMAFQMQMIPLKMLALDQENRCYIPADVVTCIIPLDTRHPIITTLVQVTSESGLIIPSGPGVPPAGQRRIVDMTGRVLNVAPPSREDLENEQS